MAVRSNPDNFDINKDGYIDYNEWMEPLCQHSFDTTPPEWVEVLKANPVKGTAKAIPGLPGTGTNAAAIGEFTEWWL